ncbi:MAG TPA: tRNA (adenosine(37)-N6)-dimethylallyltransferase MiaA [Pseudothermotoga sp.]|nr:tRNA (adenosine(37)-N6)-dimethylallyltransferase MiaA [Pseudothermotoga sp.]HOK83621.1 tRNA (adenosine(37)-N6)-dimethylallyltransferase MiaA [Pseudothermotoga sp.]HPP69260.1 tRNA (adenosine(37)-N6)-dimethylallyltransferase MiaA [Pseudothermotoga sp.]
MIIICGPTAVGKTEIAIKVCQSIDGEIVSVDSRQIYKFMDIGTAKPTMQERNLVKHHLVDIVKPDEYYNVYQFRVDAIQTVKRILQQGKIPIFVGGTGLYIDSLLKGIFDGVPRDEQLRSELLEVEKQNPGSLRRLLEQYDPEYASKIHKNDLKRTIRALEVCLKSGKKFSELQKQISPAGKFTVIILNRDRNELYDRINTRVEKMIQSGLVDEVEGLLKMGYTKELNSMKTIGYQEVIEYIERKIDYRSMIEKIKKNTRHFAKRQLIWFRRYEDALVLNVSENEDTVKIISQIVLQEARGNLFVDGGL